MIIFGLDFGQNIPEVGRYEPEVNRSQQEVTYILVVSSEYYVRMRFCTDRNNDKNNGILKASVGVPESAKLSIFIIFCHQNFLLAIFSMEYFV